MPCNALHIKLSYISHYMLAHMNWSDDSPLKASAGKREMLFEYK